MYANHLELYNLRVFILLLERFLPMSLKLLVPSIGCASCIETISKALQSADTSAIVTGDPASKTVNIDTQLPESQVRELIAIAGHKTA